MSKIYGKYVIIDGRDVGKTTEDLLRDLLFESTGARIPADKIKYGVPQALDQRPHDIYDPNTFIPVTVDLVYDTRYRTIGDGFMYRRRYISEHVKDVDFTMVKPEFYPFRTSDIIDQINAQLSYPIAMTELVEFEYATYDQWIAGIFLQAKDESYLWMGCSKIQIDTSDINHTNLLQKNELDGFNIYQPKDGVKIIDGFHEYRGGCNDPLCPICKENGVVNENTPPHVVKIIDIINRPISSAFRNTPQPDELPVAYGKELEIKVKPLPCSTDPMDVVINDGNEPVIPYDSLDIDIASDTTGVIVYSRNSDSDELCNEIDLSLYAIPREDEVCSTTVNSTGSADAIAGELISETYNPNDKPATGTDLNCKC